MEIYTVRRGDTLWGIARRYGLSIGRIAQVNGLPDPGVLVPGQALVIPTPTRTHQVRPGESLWSISRLYGLSVQALAAANQIAAPFLIYPGQRLIVPPAPRPAATANGYLEQYGETGRRIAAGTAAHLTYVSPFSYQVRADGSLVSPDDAGALAEARARGAASLLVITNFQNGRFQSDLARTLLADTAAQDRLLTAILETMRRKGHRGLNIDFEYVYPEDREAYNRFIQRAASRLKPEGFLISSALAPKVRATQQGLLYEAHDYPVHGRVMDFCVLMTYEWGWSGGPPMAVAPLPSVRQVLNYAVTAIPRRKILMGVPLYGYDWTLPYIRGQSWAAAISPVEAVRRAARFGVNIQFDAASAAPFYRYRDGAGRDHIVWFEDARSVDAKYRLVKELGLLGVSFWTLGFSFPQNWPVLEDHFQVQKWPSGA